MKEEQFKDRLVAARELKHLSQTDLARLCEMAPTQLARYETGKVIPRRAAIRKLAKALDVDEFWLVYGGPDSTESSNQLRIEKAESGETTLVLRPSPELGRRMRALAESAGITPDALLEKVLDEWAKHRRHDDPPNSDYFADLRERMGRLEEQIEIVAKAQGLRPVRFGTPSAVQTEPSTPEPTPKKSKKI